MAETPHATPPSLPPSTLFSLRQYLSTNISKARARAHAINVWFATKLPGRFHGSTGLVFKIELALIASFGFTFMEPGEWAAAIAVWVIIGAALLIKSLSWDGIRGQYGLTTFLRLAAIAGSIFVSVILIADTTLSKSDDAPWSNLKRLWKMPYSYRNALHAGLIVKPHEYYKEGEIIAGIPWRNGSIETTLELSIDPQVDLSNVELDFAFDANSMHVFSFDPNVLVKPEKNLFTGWKGGGLDKNGKPIESETHTASPEDIEALNSYPNDQFVFKLPKMYHDIPVKLVFIGGDGYQNGPHFTQAMGGPWQPHHLRITGHYEVRYRWKTETVAVYQQIIKI